MVALVTGASGLLGSHVLLYLLKSGYSVIGISQTPESISKAKLPFTVYDAADEPLFNQISWKHGDINDTLFLDDVLSGIDWVFHCAALVSFNDDDKEKMNHINIGGTANLVNICLLKNIKKFCHVSSVAALGKSKNRTPIHEEVYFVDSPDNSNYGVSKYGAEQEVWRASEEGLNTVIVNPTVIIGPGNWNSGSSNMFSSAFKGMNFYSDGATGFTDVRDVANIMVKLTKGNFSHERYLICAENLAYKQVFDWMHMAFGNKVPNIKANPFIASIVWRIEKLISFFTGSNPLITEETVSAAFQKISFSNKKITDALNYKFIPIKETIDVTANAFKKQYKK